MFWDAEKDASADDESVEDSSTRQDLRGTSEPLRDTFDRLAPEDLDPRDEDTSVEDFPIEDTPVEETPVEDTPVEDTPVEDIPDSSFSKYALLNTSLYYILIT
jgi:hypothetical protein